MNNLSTLERREPIMTKSDRLTAVSLWRAGRDTRFIASMFGVDEATVYNGLPKWREEAKMERAA